MPGKDRQTRRDSLQATTSERLAAIVEAAERAATQVIDDAEREAQRRLAEAEAQVSERLTSLSVQTDSLIAQAEEIRQRSEQLLRALTRVKAELGEDDADLTGRPPLAAVRGLHLSAVAPPPEPEPEESVAAEPEPRENGASAAGARLLATQMAISGSSREEIAERLRNGFEIDDPEAILEAILGPEG